MWLLRRPSVDGTYASALTAAINNAYAAAERSADRIAVCSAERRADRNANIGPDGVSIGHADNDTIRSADARAHCPAVISCSYVLSSSSTSLFLFWRPRSVLGAVR